MPDGDESPRNDRLSRRLLDLAVEYADAYQRTTQDDPGQPDPGQNDGDWRDQPTKLAAYGVRARYRPTPFGLFACNLIADIVDGDPVTRLDLGTDVRLRRLDMPRPTGGWFVNPTLAEDAGRWSYVRPAKGGTTSLSTNPVILRLAERLFALRAAAPRSAREWAAELGEKGTADFDLCVDKDLLLPEHEPAMLIEPGMAAAPTEPVKAVLAAARPFHADQFVDSFSEVRARLPRSPVEALVEGAAQVMREGWLPERLERLRDHVIGAFTGGAVPLTWLLAAPVEHPLGSWRQWPSLPEPPGTPTPRPRLFVPRDRRDNGAVEWWNRAHTFEEWSAAAERRESGPGLVTAAGPRFGMLNGALLGERVSGTDAWLKLIAPGYWGGPGSRLGEHLRMPDLDPGAEVPGRLVVELGWIPPDRRAPLGRRQASVTPRLNINLPHRPGDLPLSDLAVTVMDGRLQLVHRRDERYVELRADSPMALVLPGNPWVVQLLGMLLEEERATAHPDPGIRQPPGGMNPRITAGRCLVARRSLVLNARHRADLLRLAKDPDQLCDVLTEVGLGPRIEVTEASDLTMRLDLTDAAQREWFVRRLRRDTRLRLHESLPVSTPVWSDLGGHVHDVWVPWVRRESRVNPPMSRSRMVERIPAADPSWTSWHVYAPDRVVELWLARPQQVAMMHQGELFFMRYRDDRPHLRIRIRSEHATDALLAGLQGHLAAMVPQPAYEITTRPYVPEDHRYGGPARRADTLRLFCADSAWWARRLSTGPDLTGRYVLAASRIAAWCLQLADDSGALELLCELQGLDPRLPSPTSQREWMATFRSTRPDLERALDAALAEPEPALDHLSDMDQDAFRLSLSSMMHMSVNRGLPGGVAVGREAQIVLAAARLLKGRIARASRKEAVPS